VRFNQGMAIAEDWPWLLLDALDATAQQSAQLHLDLCPFWQGDPCSCGVPATIIEVRDRVFAQAGERTAERVSQTPAA